MIAKKTGGKGFATEELIRNYFLSAGFYVLRSVPFRLEGADLTDIDLWIYERSATLARRRTIIDIKDKRIPQAAERLFFVKGLAEVLKVEGAGIATSDNRPALRDLARRQSLVWLDGADLQRFKSSERLAKPDRLTEENLIALINRVDTGRSSRMLKDKYEGVKSAVSDRFGASCANTALEAVEHFAKMAVQAQPDSESARLAGRLTLLATSIAAAALDFACADVALRPAVERLRYITDALRFGDDLIGTQERLKWAQAAISEFLPNGPALARTVRDRFTEELRRVPAEGLAEIMVKAAATDRLFEAARSLEASAFASMLPAFDEIDVEARAILGAVLDFASVDRRRFANAWRPSGNTTPTAADPPRAGPQLQSDPQSVSVENRSGKLL